MTAHTPLPGTLATPANNNAGVFVFIRDLQLLHRLGADIPWREVAHVIDRNEWGWKAVITGMSLQGLKPDAKAADAAKSLFETLATLQFIFGACDLYKRAEKMFPALDDRDGHNARANLIVGAAYTLNQIGLDIRNPSEISSEHLEGLCGAMGRTAMLALDMLALGNPEKPVLETWKPAPLDQTRIEELRARMAVPDENSGPFAWFSGLVERLNKGGEEAWQRASLEITEEAYTVGAILRDRELQGQKARPDDVKSVLLGILQYMAIISELPSFMEGLTMPERDSVHCYAPDGYLSHAPSADQNRVAQELMAPAIDRMNLKLKEAEDRLYPVCPTTRVRVTAPAGTEAHTQIMALLEAELPRRIARAHGMALIVLGH